MLAEVIGFSNLLVLLVQPRYICLKYGVVAKPSMNLLQYCGNVGMSHILKHLDLVTSDSCADD